MNVYRRLIEMVLHRSGRTIWTTDMFHAPSTWEITDEGLDGIMSVPLQSEGADGVGGTLLLTRTQAEALSTRIEHFIMDIRGERSLRIEEELRERELDMAERGADWVLVPLPVYEDTIDGVEQARRDRIARHAD